MELASFYNLIQSGQLENCIIALEISKALAKEDKFFDVVTIYAVLHHIGIKDHETVISEVDRVLKANGKLLITEPYPFAFWKIWSIICRFLGTFGLPYFRSNYELRFHKINIR